MTDRAGLSFREYVDKVGGHAFLSDENFFRTVDDEVTSL